MLRITTCTRTIYFSPGLVNSLLDIALIIVAVCACTVLYIHIVITSMCTHTHTHTQVLGEVGTVQTVQATGDLRVRYSNGKVWTLNPDSVTKVPAFLYL